MKRLTLKQIQETELPVLNKQELLEYIKGSQEPINQRTRRLKEQSLYSNALYNLDKKIEEIEKRTNKIITTSKGGISAKGAKELTRNQLLYLANAIQYFSSSPTSTVKGAKRQELKTHLALKGLELDITDEELKNEYAERLAEGETTEEKEKIFKEIKKEYQQRINKAKKEIGYINFSSDDKSAFWKLAYRLEEQGLLLNYKTASDIVKEVVENIGNKYPNNTKYSEKQILDLLRELGDIE